MPHILLFGTISPPMMYSVRHSGPIKKIENGEGVGAANWRTRPLHEVAGNLSGRVEVAEWRSQPQIDQGLRVSATSVNGLGSPIGGSDLESTGDSEPEVPGRLGLGPPIGDPNPSTEVAGVFRGYRLPWWRGRGRELAAPTPNLPGTSDSKCLVDS
ncbi:hypothetical protein CRG98_040404 [Punica granatum]|uniref:Uncharacterized protein n=1 Tax=Punica granatum TaxID=22663 RepID=A0A2I0I5E0_PUNGR|nr:hypothetical protein CRG98_040404 [Punica granatum]